MALVAPVALAVLWAALNGPDARSWLVGLPVVLLATLASRKLAPLEGPVLCWRRVPTFFGAFVLDSIRGGIDVAMRALRPDLPIDPGTLTYRTRLPPGAARSLFAGAIGLLPGTLVIAMSGDALEVHALDVSADVRGGLRRLERRIARLFGIPPWPADGEAPSSGQGPGQEPGPCLETSTTEPAERDAPGGGAP